MKALRWLLAILLFLLIVSARNAIRQEAQSMKPAIRENERTPLEARDYVYYTVQPGDTIALVERKFRVVYPEVILQMNPDLNPDSLKTNQRIKIPLQ